MPAARRVRLSPWLVHGGRALAATVAGSRDVERHYAAALRGGATAVELVEIARMAHLFGGFPRAIEGLNALGSALAAARRRPPSDPEPRQGGRSARRSRGEALFRAIYGDDRDRVLARLDATARGYSGWVVEDAYGRVLARPGLDAATRELLAVAVLAALHCPAQLKSHARGAVRLGASSSDVARMVELGQATGRRKSGARQTRRRRRQ